MAEVYTVTVNNITATEITGGRVGHFAMVPEGISLHIGSSDLAVSYSSEEWNATATVTDGIGVPAGLYRFYVTSPDDVRLLMASRNFTNPLYTEQVVTIFHNR